MDAEASDARQALNRRVTHLLNGALGAFPWPAGTFGPLGPRLSNGPVKAGLVAGICYALLFLVLPELFCRPVDPHLFWLSAYASIYIAWAVATARATSADILDRIERRIVPVFPEETCLQIEAALARRFKEVRLAAMSWSLAIIGALIAAVAIRHDIGGAQNLTLQILWWSVGWMFIFVTAARATDVARFYYVFSEHLSGAEAMLYVVNPTQSRIVSDVSLVGRRMLMFWLGIAISIAFLIPFINLADPTVSPTLPRMNWAATYGYFANPAELHHPIHPEIDFAGAHRLFQWPSSLFLLIISPLVFLWSIPFGTYIFLRSEAAIRCVADGVLYRRILAIEQDVATLYGRLPELDADERARFAAFTDLHKTLTAAGGYRNLFASGLSLAIPLVGPLIGLLAKRLN